MKRLLRASVPAGAKAPSGRLIVVESGARALASCLSADGRDETTVVAQGADEAPVELPFRVMGRLAVIERGGGSVDRAVVAIASKLDAQSRAAREVVARALHAHMTAAGSGELVLAAHGANAELRHELLSLVETLVCEHDRSSVTIRLQFRADGPRLARASGMRPVVRDTEGLSLPS
jgi:hypothetical protein